MSLSKTQLTVFTTVPTLYFSDSENDPHTEDSISKLEQELNTLRGEANNIDLSVGMMFSSLASKFITDITELQRLQTEVQKLTAIPEVIPGPEPEADRTPQPEEVVAKEPSEKKVEKSVNELNRLWKKIARITHPDKTKDPLLNQVFLVAKEAYTRGDLEFLKEIYSGLKQGKKRFSKLKVLLEKMLAERSKVLHYISIAKSSFEYSLYVMYSQESLKANAEDLYREQLSKQIQNLKRNINALDNSKYPQPKPRFIPTTTFTSWGTF